MAQAGSTKIQLERATWVLGGPLGGGGFAQVYEASAEDGDQAALKLIPKAPGAERELLFEDLSGARNVVPIIDRGDWNDYWVIVMPRAEKSLDKYLAERGGPLFPEETISILSDVVDALENLDGRVVHRDLKPGNVLLLDERWCLADFGIARYAEAATAPDTRKHALTPPYAAPERWRDERATIAADVYAVGVMAFEMLTGQLPFPGPGGADFREQHLHEEPPVLSGVGPQLESLVMECMYKAPEARPRPANLAGRLSRAMDPVSPAAARLQEANQIAVREAQDHAIQASAQESEEARRAGLYAAAETSFARISGLLRQSIAESASAARFETRKNGEAWVATLNSAQLAFDQITQSQSGLLNAAFDVVAYSFVLMTVRGARAWEGRSHSLWFCDARMEGEFHWFEVAFMLNPISRKQTRVVPFGLEPGPQADEAFWPGIGTHQVAFGPKAIDQGNEQWFVDRWMEMFAEAALGRLNHPSRLPENVEPWRS